MQKLNTTKYIFVNKINCLLHNLKKTMFYKYHTPKLGILIPLLGVLLAACDSKPKRS